MRTLLKFFMLLLLLFHIPIGCSLFRSYEVARYQRAFDLRLDSTEVPFQDVRGGIHVHSMEGGHSLGTYPEIIEAAVKAGYRYVFITEHPKEPAIFKKLEDRRLVILYGFEENRSDGARVLRTEDWSLTFLTHHPDTSLPDNLSGMEVYNLHENARLGDNWFQRINFLYHHLLDPELFFLHIWQIDRNRITLWEREWERDRSLTGIAGNDAHQNVGLIVQTADGRKSWRLLVDPYYRSFQFVSTHLFLPLDAVVDEQSVLGALRQGAAYVAFEKLGDPTGFTFHAETERGILPMGSNVDGRARLVFAAPFLSHFKLFRNGEIYRELEGQRFVLEAPEPGVFRVEVFPVNPPSLLGDKPWILSNPIRVGE